MAAKSTGKGVPPPPAPPLSTGAKAKGKGKSATLPAKGASTELQQVPDHLRASGPHRLAVHAPRHPPSNGRIWRSINCWSSEGPNVLEGFSINTQALLEQLNLPPPAPPAAPPAAPAPHLRILGNAKLVQNLEIAVRAAGISPDLIRRGLTEDFDVLSQVQAQILCDTISPALEQVRGPLTSFVQDQGVAALRDTEQVLWTMDNIAGASELAAFASARHALPESRAFACNPIRRFGDHLFEMDTSKPLRTLLQGLLVATNVLTQRDNSAMNARTIMDFARRRVHASGPSIITLVAHDLQRSHDERCRRRLSRALALNRLPIPRHSKQLVWQYLDDLQETPWDVIKLLRTCREFVWLRDLKQNLQVETDGCRSLIQRIRRHTQRATPSRDGTLSRQLEDLTRSAEEAFYEMDGLTSYLDRQITLMLELFGNDGRRDEYGSCSELLGDLSVLGSQLQQEKEKIDRDLRLQRSRALMGHHGEISVAWEPVNTNHIALHATRDPDLIRELKFSAGRTKNDASQMGETSNEARSRREGALAKEGNSCEKKHAQLLHGGPQGQYERCALTGQWTATGLAAVLAARDGSMRGATAGFFTTY